MLKRVKSLAYKLKLPLNSQVHPIFHVSGLRKWLYKEDNIVDEGILFEYIEPPCQPHEREQILDQNELHTHHHVCCQK